MTTANTKIPTRGERNNNPGNIERNTIRWLGMAGIQSDSRFCSFTTPAYGIRALGKLVTNYYRNYKLNTIAKIINRWAPAIENNTDAYIIAVSTACSLGKDDLITILTPALLMLIVKAIITHENGRCIYTDADITSALLIK